MELRDLIVTPIVIIIVYCIAYYVRPFCTDQINRRYFIPALSVKIFGAIAVGFIYQFYYSGGDTFNYHTHGSRIIWESFGDSFSTGFRLLFSGDDIYKYSSKILFYKDDQSFFIIRIAALLDLLTFSSYSATAVLFAVCSFIGSWMFFLTFYDQYPQQHFQLAIASFFIPSVFFWGAGILKDTITLACLGLATYQIYKLFIKGTIRFSSIIILLLSILIIFNVKKFMLQAFFPAAILWITAHKFYSIPSAVLRILVVPISILLVIVSAYYAVVKVGEGDRKYAIDKIAETAKITAYDIGFYTGRDAGSGYSLGELDGSLSGILSLAPVAINVSLFRPYLWEVNNPLMFISSLESTALLLLCAALLFKNWKNLFGLVKDPNILFCLTFSIAFAFSVGVSTFNFGTLSRYRIPLLPFFLTGLFLVLSYSNRVRKFDELEKTEY